MLKTVSLLLLVSAALMAQNLASVAITRTPGGKAVPKDFVGLSVEEDIGLKYFGPSNNPNKVFFTLMRNIGPGTLRMGGNSEDYVCWTGAPGRPYKRACPNRSQTTPIR